MSYKQTYLRQYFFSNNAGNSGVIVPCTKALSGTALYPTTAAGNPGINNGGIDPYISSQNIKLVGLLDSVECCDQQWNMDATRNSRV